MFENTQQPQDMFEGMETPPPPGIASAASQPAPAAPQDIPVVSSGGGVPWKIILIVLALIAVIGLAAWVAYALLSSHPTSTPTPEPSSASSSNTPSKATPTPTPPTTPTSSTTDASTTTPPATTPSEATTPAADSDKDGLTDAQEASLGTNPLSADTDGDGLFDKEEVQTYHTDPLNPDTDGDGYSDGTEVKAGYNPNGAGKLFQVP